MEKFWEEERIKFETSTTLLGDENAPKKDVFWDIYNEMSNDEKFEQIFDIVWESETGEPIIAILQSLSLSAQVISLHH